MSKAPTSLPAAEGEGPTEGLVEEEVVEVDPNMPEGLPEEDPTEEVIGTAAARSAEARVCNACGKENARVSSNSSGVAAHCPCGNWWPIASRPMAPALPTTPDRGLNKQTLVEPNWDIAFEEIGEGVDNDKIGPKGKG